MTEVLRRLAWRLHSPTYKSHFSRKSKTSSSKINSVFQLCRLPFKQKPSNLLKTRSDFDILLQKKKKKKTKQTLPISYLLFPNILLWLGIAIWKNRDLTKTPNGKPGFMKSLLSPKNFTGEFGKVTKRWGHQLMNNPSRWHPLHNEQASWKTQENANCLRTLSPP